MVLRRMGWVPPLLGLVAAASGYFALAVGASPVIAIWTQEGNKPLAVIAVERPALGWLALALVVLGLVVPIGHGAQAEIAHAVLRGHG